MGYQLTQEQCEVCKMPFMLSSKSKNCRCVVCITIKLKAKRVANFKRVEQHHLLSKVSSPYNPKATPNHFSHTYLPSKPIRNDHYPNTKSKQQNIPTLQQTTDMKVVDLKRVDQKLTLAEIGCYDKDLLLKNLNYDNPKTTSNLEDISPIKRKTEEKVKDDKQQRQNQKQPILFSLNNCHHLCNDENIIDHKQAKNSNNHSHILQLNGCSPKLTERPNVKAGIHDTKIHQGETLKPKKFFNCPSGTLQCNLPNLLKLPIQEENAYYSDLESGLLLSTKQGEHLNKYKICDTNVYNNSYSKGKESAPGHNKNCNKNVLSHATNEQIEDNMDDTNNFINLNTINLKHQQLNSLHDDFNSFKGVHNEDSNKTQFTINIKPSDTHSKIHNNNVPERGNTSNKKNLFNSEIQNQQDMSNHENNRTFFGIPNPACTEQVFAKVEDFQTQYYGMNTDENNSNQPNVYEKKEHKQFNNNENNDCYDIKEKGPNFNEKNLINEIPSTNKGSKSNPFTEIQNQQDMSNHENNHTFFEILNPACTEQVFSRAEDFQTQCCGGNYATINDNKVVNSGTVEEGRHNKEISNLIDNFKKDEGSTSIDLNKNSVIKKDQHCQHISNFVDKFEKDEEQITTCVNDCNNINE